MAKEDVLLPVRCDCGEEYKVPIAGVELETLDLRCPACGQVDRLTDEQIKQIVAEHAAIAEAVRKVAVDKFKDIARDFNRRQKRR